MDTPHGQNRTFYSPQAGGKDAAIATKVDGIECIDGGKDKSTISAKVVRDRHVNPR